MTNQDDSTKGNLEMRIGGETWYGINLEEGHVVYKAIAKFADFLIQKTNPKFHEYQDWFKQTFEELKLQKLPAISAFPHDVVIDVTRKLIIYNLELSEQVIKLIPGKTFTKLKENGYRIIRYELNEPVEISDS